MPSNKRKFPFSVSQCQPHLLHRHYSSFCRTIFMPEHITSSIMTSLLLVYYYSSIFGLLLHFVPFYRHQTLQNKMAASVTKGRISLLHGFI